MAISYPPIFINKYLQDKLPNDTYNNPVPFFPTSPTDINTLTESFPDGFFAVYDRMFKFRRKPFPHIKSEQLLYYFYKTVGDPEKLIESTQMVYDLLDREDESAQDLNKWIESKVSSQTGLVTFDGKEFYPVYFHNTKVYQLEETRDIVDFGTARTFAGNKLIIDYDYHTVGYSDGKYNGTTI